MSLTFLLRLKKSNEGLESKIWVLPCLRFPNKALIYWNKTFCKIIIYGTQIHEVLVVFVLSSTTVTKFTLVSLLYVCDYL